MLTKEKILSIPAFNGRCHNIWVAWSKYLELRKVNRIGHIWFDVYGKFAPEEADLLEPENDLEHVLSCVAMLMFIKDAFGEFLKGYVNRKTWESWNDTLLLHEVGEIDLLDIPYDGRDTSEKDFQEAKFMRKFLEGFSLDSRCRHINDFTKFQNPDAMSMPYLIDKGAFVSMLLWFAGHKKSIFDEDGKEKEIGEGTVVHHIAKKTLSPNDQHYYELTGSTRAVDNMFAHFLDNTRHIVFQPIVAEIIKEGYLCVYGEVPSCLDQFFH